MRVLLPVVFAVAVISVPGSGAQSVSSGPLLTYSVTYAVDRLDQQFVGGICATGPGGRSFRVSDPYLDLTPSWSPDGKWIAFSRSLDRPPPVKHLSDIFITDAQGAHGRNLTQRAGGTVNGDPVWSPDGTRIAFTTSWYGGSLYIVNTDGTGSHEVFGVDWPKALGVSDWSPDGRRLLVTTYDPSDISSPRIYAVDPDNGTRTELAQHASSAVWSPDGTRVAYAVSTGAAWNLVVARADGGDPETIAAFVNQELAWSPDGQWIAFTRGPFGSGRLMLVKPDGSGEHALPTGDLPVAGPAWRPAAALPPNRRPCLIPATPHGDVLRGTARGDLIDGKGGNDTIYGLGGDDTIIGGTGRDRLYGGTGRDLVGARDGMRDLVSGWRGFDSAYVDKRDRLTSVELKLGERR